MGYYMRFIASRCDGVTLHTLETALKTTDPRYHFEYHTTSEGRPFADLLYDSDLYAQLEVNAVGDDIFEDAIEERLEFLDGAGPGDLELVTRTLHKAQAIVSLRVIWYGREPEDVLQRIDPLWEILFRDPGGLLQADGEGYYGALGLVLAVD